MALASFCVDIILLLPFCIFQGKYKRTTSSVSFPLCPHNEHLTAALSLRGTETDEHKMVKFVNKQNPN